MIEEILRKQPGTFFYGAVEAVDKTQGQVQVRLRSDLLVQIQTSLSSSLQVDDTVIVAENDQDSSRFIVQYSKKAVPLQGTLLLV